VTGNHVSANVRRELARRKMAHTDLCALLGLASSSVSRRMCGDVSFRVDELATIADHLGIDVATLVKPPRASKGTKHTKLAVAGGP